MSEFDEFAKDYDQALERGISLSGEGKDFFATQRLELIRQYIDRSMTEPLSAIVDFGCGTGTSCPLLKELNSVQQVVGVDPSSDSLRVAEGLNGGEGISYTLPEECSGEGIFDGAFCNGVFHHIPLDERDEACSWIYQRLKPGGIFFFWENNPLNIGTQIVMSRIPFDRDAIKLTPWNARSMLTRAGFTIVRTQYAFIFPAFLKFFRGLEPALSRFPLGAQYMIVAVKKEGY